MLAHKGSTVWIPCGVAFLAFGVALGVQSGVAESPFTLVVQSRCGVVYRLCRVLFVIVGAWCSAPLLLVLAWTVWGIPCGASELTEEGLCPSYFRLSECTRSKF